jgi:16S rRNA (cytosine967-C5)-methyltransferase
MRAMNDRPPMTVRANTLRLTREALAQRLTREEQLAGAPTAYAPEGLILEHGGAPAGWPAFAEGTFAVQDEASMLIARLLDVQPGYVVVDAVRGAGHEDDAPRAADGEPRPHRGLRSAAGAAGAL